jgi:glyoxylase-like metal-dependent hydrolase (beta-lactamase superfamily II)
MYYADDLGTKKVSCFVISTPDKRLIVVDSGYPGGFAQFKKKFESKGYDKRLVKFLFLTHSHDDHVGFLQEMLEYFTDANLILHHEAVRRLKLGRNLKIHSATSKMIQSVCKFLEYTGLGKHKFPAVDAPKRYLLFAKDEQYLRESKIEIDIVPLPGHTADSIGLMLPGKRLICGDAVFNMPALSKNYYPLVLEDALMLQKTWSYICRNAVTLIPSHGKPLSVDCIRAYWEGLASLPDYPIFGKKRRENCQ